MHFATILLWPISLSRRCTTAFTVQLAVQFNLPGLESLCRVLLLEARMQVRPYCRSFFLMLGCVLHSNCERLHPRQSRQRFGCHMATATAVSRTYPLSQIRAGRVQLFASMLDLKFFIAFCSDASRRSVSTRLCVAGCSGQVTRRGTQTSRACGLPYWGGRRGCRGQPSGNQALVDLRFKPCLVMT